MNKPIEELTKVMMDEINPIINEVLKGEQYNETMFLGKSLGTIPIANDLMKRRIHAVKNDIAYTFTNF